MALADELGQVAWYSMMTTDPATTNAFYTKLFDWQISETEIPDMGTVQMYSGPEGPFAGPVPLEAEAGLPSHWMTYFAVADVDDACARVESLGGTVCEAPFDLPGIGRTAVITDPAGAALHPFTPEKKDEDVSVMGGEPGQPCWLELTVDDTGPVRRFYAELLGWTIVERDMGMPDPYLIGHSGETMVAGITKRPEGVAPMPAAWLPYFMVADLPASVALARELGAQTLVEPTQIPGMGHFALLQDPAGAVTYLFQGEDSDD